MTPPRTVAHQAAMGLTLAPLSSRFHDVWSRAETNTRRNATAGMAAPRALFVAALA